MFGAGSPPAWVTTCVVAEDSHVAPDYYDPTVPRIVWYYRVLALHNARASAEDYHRRKAEQRQRMGIRR